MYKPIGFRGWRKKAVKVFVCPKATPYALGWGVGVGSARFGVEDKKFYLQTVSISMLRSPVGNGLLKKVQGDKVLRVTQQRQPMRVIITEEEYMP